MSRRPLWAALVGWGVALVAAPRRVVRLIGGADPPTAVVRVLGIRRLLQQLVIMVRPTPAVAVATAAVDGVHAASMLLAARMWPRHRRVALVSAAVSVGSAAVTLLGGRNRRA